MTLRHLFVEVLKSEKFLLYSTCFAAYARSILFFPFLTFSFVFLLVFNSAKVQLLDNKSFLIDFMKAPRER